MKEILFSPQLIENEKKRLEEKNADSTDAGIYELLIKVYGSKSVANYLNWYAERTTTNSIRESTRSNS